LYVEKGANPEILFKNQPDYNSGGNGEMTRTDWIYVMDDGALPEGDMTSVYPLGINVVMARVNGTVHAISGKCPHMACPLFTGTLDGHILTCPCHDWRWDIRTGKFLDAPDIRLSVYHAKSEAGKLFVSFT
jgi:nitrite reductase/ring-hydroxylating ferredoxin subunit